MKARNRPHNGARELRAEVDEVFRELQFASPGDLRVERGADRVRDYRPDRLKVADPATAEAALEQLQPGRVSGDLRYAARHIGWALGFLADGLPMMPGVVPTTGKGGFAFRAGMGFERSISEGGRSLYPSDDERVRKTFVALFGVPLERYWELILEQALRNALLQRLDRRIKVANGVPVAALPEIASEQEILAAVREESPSGTVPTFLNVKVIRLALEQCTDAARGGGRGEAKKVAIRRWIAGLKKKAAGANKRTRPP